jgi:dTDP-4-dehydrorhamnose 3,5-epimerase
MNRTIQTFQGDIAVDDRGSLRFVNDFDFADVKRFYQVENHDDDTVRAFHGHMKEAKYVYVASGSIILCLAPLNEKNELEKNSKVERLVLSAAKPKVVYVPAGYVNGFRALEKNTKIIFFSTTTLQESLGDDYRFPYDFFGEEIWEVENR